MATTTIQKWGNSYAVRLPKEAIEKLKLGAGHRVTVRAGKGRSISIEPTENDSESLEGLVARITPRNRHTETRWGQSVGEEVW